MLVEELLPLAVLLVGAITLVVFAVRRGRTRQPIAWAPTFANLHLVCVECEHELLAHPNGRGICTGQAPTSVDHRASPACRCRLTRRRAFRSALTPFELAARKEMLP